MDASQFHGSLPNVLDVREPHITALGTLDTATLVVLTSWDARAAELESLGIAKDARVPDDLAGFSLHSMWARELKLTSRSPSTALWEIPLVGLIESSEKRKTTITNNVNRRTPEKEEEVLSGPIRDMDGNLIYKTSGGSYWNPDTEREYLPGEFISREFTDESTAQTDQELPDPKVTVTTTWFTTRFPAVDPAGQSMDPPLDIPDPLSILETLEIPRTNEQDATIKEWNNGRLAVAAHPVRRQYLAGWVCDSRSIDPLFFSSGVGPGIRPVAGDRRRGIEGDPGLFAVTDVISYYPAWTLR